VCGGKKDPGTALEQSLHSSAGEAGPPRAPLLMSYSCPRVRLSDTQPPPPPTAQSKTASGKPIYGRDKYII